MNGNGNGNYRFRLQFESPIHVGSGLKYPKVECVSLNGMLYRMSIDSLFSGMRTDEVKRASRDMDLNNFDAGSYVADEADAKRLCRYSMLNSTDFGIGDKQQRYGDMSEHIKTSGMGYIPGSSIKGSIRTALLYDMVAPDDIERVLSECQNMRGNRQYWHIDKFFQRLLSKNGAGNLPQNSVMRFIHVSDTAPVDGLEIADVRIAEAVHDGSWRWYRNGVDMYQECIPAGTELNGTISLDTGVAGLLGLGNKADMLDVGHIKKCCHRFAADLIEHEISFAEEYKMPFLARFYAEKLYGLNEKDSPLIRIGQGSGLLSTTLGLLVKNHDAEYGTHLFDEVKEITKGRKYDFEYPKTRKIAVNRAKQPVHPFGWAKLFID